MLEPNANRDAARANLEAERARLLAELGEPIESPGQMTYGSQAAAASHVFEQQRDLALRDRSRAELQRVENALRKLDAGGYGVCESCGNAIAAERLEAIPWARERVEYKTGGLGRR